MAEKKLWKYSDLTGLNLSTQDLDYLCSNGLEVGRFGCIAIYSEYEISKGCIVLGYDSDVPIVCSENGRGVFSIEGNEKRFVNSSVEQFSLTVGRFSKYCELVQEANSEKDALVVVYSTINDMKEIDRAAWSEDINYWPIIGQQMIEGNL